MARIPEKSFTYYIYSMEGKAYLKLGFLDPNYALAQSQQIKNNIPLFQTSNSTENFYNIYEQYLLWNDSDVPLVKSFFSLIRKHENQVKALLGEYKCPQWCLLSYVSDTRKPISKWHTDIPFLDAFYHLSILGNANIEFKDLTPSKKIQKLFFSNGTFWLLHSSKYSHRICSTKEKLERYELLAPVNEAECLLQIKRKAVVADSRRWIDPNHPEIKNSKIEQQKLVDEIKNKETKDSQMTSSLNILILQVYLVSRLYSFQYYMTPCLVTSPLSVNMESIFTVL